MKTGVLSTLGRFNQCVCVWGGGGGAVRFRPIQPVGGGEGVLSALGQFNQWGGGVHLWLSLCLKRGRVPSIYMAILETMLLPVSLH